jgi:TolB-like protein/DNA-binding winged helix-turn-helix (wHTH) protein/Tfp pilus assembly protein PilF
MINFPAIRSASERIEISVPSAREYRFESFTLNARTGELSNSGQKTPLREQPFLLLLALLERPGDLVTREELVRRLWPNGTFVDFDRSLNKAVNHLRDTLGDSAENPRFIETLPRKGYRFIAPVSPDQQELKEGLSPLSSDPSDKIQASPRRPHRWFLLASAILIVLTILLAANVAGSRNWIVSQLFPHPQISALAVLPLENLSGDPEQAYFADGMTDALITDLAKMGSVRVISRTTVMRYKQTRKTITDIGRELNVQAVVEGTVTRSGDRVRITAQLIQVSTDMHLWAEAYERNVSEVLGLQREVANDIARRISGVVRPLEPARTVNPQAYGLYLQGRDQFYRYTTEGWQQAIQLFNRAIQSDPQFAPAYSGLADAYLVAGAYGAIPNQEALIRGKAAAAKALALDDKLASAHYAMATIYAWYDWDWAKAEQEFQRALALNPNDPLGRNWHGGYLSLQGRHAEALEEHERARELDPLSLIVNANLARALYWARRYEESIAQAKRTLQIDPKFGVALFWLEGALRHQGRFEDAVALRKAVTTPERAIAIDHTFQSRGFDPLLLESGEMFEKEGAPVEAARCYAQLGRKEQALAQLEACYKRRCSSMVTVKAEPDFDVLRSDPDFQSLLQRIGLL